LMPPTYRHYLLVKKSGDIGFLSRLVVESLVYFQRKGEIKKWILHNT
jgi:hypothetical protein